MKKILSIILSLIIAVSSMPPSVAFAQGEAISSMSFDAGNTESSLDDISWMYQKQDGKYYFFAPSTADLSALTVFFDAQGDVFVDGVKIESGAQTSVFSEEKEYTVSCNGNDYTLVVLKSAQIPAMYISTKSGTMDKVHADKEYKESGKILITDADGAVEYDGKLSHIKGRGNYSWDGFIKKPYSIKLYTKTNLFKLGKAKGWNLIANFQDNALVKNHSIYDWSEELGLPYSVENVFVDLYIDGQYYGNYMLTEKIEPDDKRVPINDLEGANEAANTGIDIEECPLAGNRGSYAGYGKGTIRYVDIPNEPDDVTGGYILEADLPERYEAEVSGFVSNYGAAIVIKSPEYASKAEAEYISSYYQEFEDAVLSPDGINGLGKHYSDYIDVDSFVKMFVMQEYTFNADGGKTSFFMYKDSGGKLVASPAWDFDNGLTGCVVKDRSGNLITRPFWPVDNGDIAGSAVDWLMAATGELIDFRTDGYCSGLMTVLSSLYNHDEFRNAVAKEWHNLVSENVGWLTDYISSENSRIEKSAVMDAIRWNKLGTTDIGQIKAIYASAAQSLKNCCEKRAQYLDSLLVENSCGIHYYSNGAKRVVFDANNYPAGATAVIRDNAYEYPNAEFLGWNTKADGSGTAYQPGQSVTVNGTMILYARWKMAASGVEIADKFSDIYLDEVIPLSVNIYPKNVVCGAVSYTSSDESVAIISSSGQITPTGVGSVTVTVSVDGKSDSFTFNVHCRNHIYAAAAVKAPTCLDAGYTDYACVNCGEAYTGDHTPALGHSYGKNGACIRCGEKDPDYKAPSFFSRLLDSIRSIFHKLFSWLPFC